MGLNVVVAQGGSYYGSALMTSALSLDEIKAKLEAAGMGVRETSDFVQATKVRERWLTVDFGGLPNGDSGYALVRPWDGLLQPEPVLVFCSGFSEHDLAHLRRLKAILDA